MPFSLAQPIKTHQKPCVVLAAYVLMTLAGSNGLVMAVKLKHKLGRRPRGRA